MKFGLKTIDEIQEEFEKTSKELDKDICKIKDGTADLLKSHLDAYIQRTGYHRILKLLIPKYNDNFKTIKNKYATKNLSDIDVIKHRIFVISKDFVNEFESIRTYEKFLEFQGLIKALLFASGYYNLNELLIDYAPFELNRE